jgi:hypothetical protein
MSTMKVKYQINLDSEEEKRKSLYYFQKNNLKWNFQKDLVLLC